MKNQMIAGVSLLAMIAGAPALADDHDPASVAELEARIEQLEATNAQLIEILRAQGLLPASEGGARVPAPQAAPPASMHTAQGHTAQGQGVHRTDDHHGGGHHARHDDEWHHNLVGVSPNYGYRILDHAEGVNTRELTILQAMQNGELDRRVTLSGGITAIADYQESNSNSKFSWLMRHPTSNNQIGETVSEMVVHSAQLATTARLTDNITTYVEFLYNPQQSFGQGTITDLNRNQVQVRKAFVMWGNLEERPVYVALGKMDTPFGLQNTVSPFTNSTSWHAFAGLAYGGMVGYYDNGFHLRAMAIQGGAQFRSHNVPVEGTNVPSRLNNFAVDANYTADLNAGQVTVGASYTHGSPYCQDYPVFHFMPCQDNNPAWAVYAQGRVGAFEFLGEYAETTEIWPGTASPAPQFAAFEAVAPEAFTLGARYWMSHRNADDLALSFEFSHYTSGADGSPWERQDQWVLGASYFVTPSVNLFGEVIQANGWVPLNFLSGGNQPGGASWSEFDARTNAIVVGAQAAF
jgi:hypothetical protein